MSTARAFLGIIILMLTQMREIRENGGSREEVRAVLTDDQRSQMQQWRQENPQGSKGGKHHRGQSSGEDEIYPHLTPALSQ